VVRDICLKCTSWTGIAEVPTEVTRAALIELNGDGRDTDAIVQVGTNLSMVKLAAARNSGSASRHRHQHRDLWHALRRNGIADKIRGLGRLLEEF